MTDFPVQKIREDFPILHQLINNHPLVYFDNAASTQKPLQVINAITGYYETDNCNIHRGVHFLSQRATETFEDTRKLVQRFINAASSNEIIFTKGTTESINLVASSFGKKYLSLGDEVLISIMEHHSNLVPWQQVCLERDAKIRYIPIHENGELDMNAFRHLVNEKTKLVAVTHVSNVLGTINPVKEIITYAHSYNIPVLIDGAQSIAHVGADMHDLDCDFYCFSGHKMYAPMGIGVLYGKEKFLEELPPYQFGGEMIKTVHTDYTTFNDLPFKFEAGTPNVEGVYGLHAAILYLQNLGLENIRNYEEEILRYATDKMNKMNDIRIIGTAKDKTSLISFLIGIIHPYDAGVIIDKLGIAVRTGHHCAMPLIEWYKIPATVRASFTFYNTKEEIDLLMDAIIKVKQMFG
ncbi:MAG: cysteine desulfurase [Bacteroidales bacterium]|jgi:cysteine desulfurase/selenocysteine lyase